MMRMLISCIHRRVNLHLPLDENPLLLSSISPTLLASSVPSFRTFHRMLNSAARWRKWVLSDMTFSTINYHCLYLSISFFFCRKLSSSERWKKWAWPDLLLVRNPSSTSCSTIFISADQGENLVALD